MFKFIKALLLVSLFFAFVTRPTSALVPPDFPACINPQGTVIASYNSGLHGIPGDISTHTGQDTVYAIESQNAVQCLCENSGQGIQTNWWKNNSLNDLQRKELLNDGWQYIADGSAWGLENSVYYAKNSYYICGPVGRGGGEVLGANTFDFAQTGNKAEIYFFFILGFTFIFTGYKLHRMKS